MNKYTQNTLDYLNLSNNKKLSYDDQFIGKLSLSRALTEVSGHDVGFDSWDMYDSKTGETILEAALNKTRSFRTLVNVIKKYYVK